MSQPPDLRTLLLGSRFTGPLIVAGCAFVTYRWWEAGGQGIIGILAMALCIASARAMARVSAHRRWQAQWQAMTPGATNKRPKRGPVRIATVVGLCLVLAAVMVATQLPLSTSAHDWLVTDAIGCAVLVVGLLLVRLVWRHWRRKPKAMPLVSVAVKRAGRRVPTVRGCYQNLPPYCQYLLKGRA